MNFRRTATSQRDVQVAITPDQARKEHEMKNVIVGFDGSAQARDALILGAQLAMEEPAWLHVAFVQRDENSTSESQRFDRVFDEASTALLGEPFREHRLRQVDAAEALSDLATELRADVIVVGSCHRGAAGRVVYGSVGENLLQGAPCAVAVAPQGYAEHDHFGFGVIGVAYTGSPESQLALDEGARLASHLDCSLRLIGVVPETLPAGQVTGNGQGFQRVFRTALERVHAEGRARVEERVGVESRFGYGDPAQVLAGQGVELDLLVIGSRGYGPVHRTLLGSVAAEVMRNAPCPVIVTPRPADMAKPAERDSIPVQSSR